MRDEIIAFVIGFLITAIGILLWNRFYAPKIVPETKNEIILEMDRSCFDQFKNNMDKTLYLKLQLK